MKPKGRFRHFRIYQIGACKKENGRQQFLERVETTHNLQVEVLSLSTWRPAKMEKIENLWTQQGELGKH